MRRLRPPHIDEDECVETTSTDCPQGEGKHTEHGKTKGTLSYCSDGPGSFQACGEQPAALPFLDADCAGLSGCTGSEFVAGPH